MFVVLHCEVDEHCVNVKRVERCLNLQCFQLGWECAYCNASVEEAAKLGQPC